MSDIFFFLLPKGTRCKPAKTNFFAPKRQMHISFTAISPLFLQMFLVKHAIT